MYRGSTVLVVRFMSCPPGRQNSRSAPLLVAAHTVPNMLAFESDLETKLLIYSTSGVSIKFLNNLEPYGTAFNIFAVSLTQEVKLCLAQKEAWLEAYGGLAPQQKALLCSSSLSMHNRVISFLY